MDEIGEDSLKEMDEAVLNVPNLGSIVKIVDEGPDQQAVPELACFTEAQKLTRLTDCDGTYETERSYKRNSPGGDITEFEHRPQTDQSDLGLTGRVAAAFAEDNTINISESSWLIERDLIEVEEPKSGMLNFSSPTKEEEVGGHLKESVPVPATMEYESQGDEYQLNAEELRLNLDELQRTRSPTMLDCRQVSVNQKDLSMIEEGQETVMGEEPSASLYTKSPEQSMYGGLPRSSVMSSADKKQGLRLNPIMLSSPMHEPSVFFTPTSANPATGMRRSSINGRLRLQTTLT